MKKYLKTVTIILLLILVSTSLFACINPDSDRQGKMTLVVLDGANTVEYSVDLAKLPKSSKGLVGVLDYLKENEGLEYSSNDSGYGVFLTKVNNLQEGNGSFIYLYTDVEEDFDVSQYASHITYKDKQYTNSGLGVSQMSIKADCTIIITLYAFS